MNCSTPGFPVLYYLLKFAQAHVHWVSDAIQPSHPLFPPSPLALNLSKHHIFSNKSALWIRWPRYWSFSWSIPMNIQGWFPLGLIGSPCCPRDSEESSLAPQFESIDFLALSLLYGYMTTGKTIALTIWTLVRKVMSLLFNTLSRNFPVARMVKNLFAM